MNIFLTRKLPQEILSVFPPDFHVDMYECVDNPMSRRELLERVHGVHAILSLITEQIDATVMDHAGSSLQVVANMAVGFDNIDIEAATKRSIIVTNTPDVLTETTADLVFGLLLSTARRIPESVQFLASGQWTTWSPMLLTGLDVYGKTIGIIGLGRIGQAVARRALGFGMRVVYTSQTRKLDLENSLSYEYLPLDDLCRVADFIVPLTPAAPKTHHLIGLREFTLMKKTAILINASRGSVVDESALIQALTNNLIFAAGLDVYNTEPLSLDNPLMRLKNAVLLPHIGSASVQTRIQMGIVAAKNIVQVLSGNKPDYRVN